MDNKNEKTFADLFSSVDEKKNEEVSAGDKKATFDSLVNEVFSDNKDSISFGDMTNIKEDETSNQIASNIGILEISNFGEDTDNLVVEEKKNVGNDVNESKQDGLNEKLDFGDIVNVEKDFSDNTNVSSSLKDGNSLFFESNVEFINEDKNNLENNLFFNNDNGLKETNDSVLKETNASLESNDVFFNTNEQNDSEEVKEEIVNSNEDVKDDVNKNNMFFSDKVEENNNLELKDDNISFSNQNVVDNKEGKNNNQDKEVDNDNNLFFNSKLEVDDRNTLELDKNDKVETIQNSNFLADDIFKFDNKDEKSYSNENLFFSDNSKSSIGESINQMLIENENKKVLEEKEKVATVSVSPFFEDSNKQLEKIGENIFNNKISFDETKNVNSKLDKIELSATKNFNVKLVKKKVPLLKFIMGVISYAFFIFLVLILVTLLAYVLDIKIRAAKGDYSPPVFNAYVVLTGSMLPEIQVKDVVVTKKVDADTLKVGDIITFASVDSRFSGTIITHRIIKKNQDSDGNITFQTKGDNNNVADSALVQPNNIYGKVIVKIPKLGYLQDFLATQGGWIIVILLPCVAVISYDVVKLAKGIKKRKNRIKVIK